MKVASASPDSLISPVQPAQPRAEGKDGCRLQSNERPHADPDHTGGHNFCNVSMVNVPMCKCEVTNCKQITFLQKIFWHATCIHVRAHVKSASIQ